MDLKLKLNTLRNELACTIDYFEKKQKKTKKGLMLLNLHL